MSHVDLDRRDGVAFITLNRPDKLNAMNEEMWGELGRVWDEFAADADLRAAVVSGAGDKGFFPGSSGAVRLPASCRWISRRAARSLNPL